MASTYYHVVLYPAHRMMGMRNGREAKTLCRALDLLAKRETGAAADLLCQRVKALEKSLGDGDWSRAQYLELLPPEGMTMVDRDEELMVQRENELQVKIQGKGKNKNEYGWWNVPPWKGVGKGKQAKDKGKDKGKGKEAATPALGDGK